MILIREVHCIGAPNWTISCCSCPLFLTWYPSYVAGRYMFVCILTLPVPCKGMEGVLLCPSACQVRVDSFTPTLMPVLCPSGMSPDTSASASPHPGRSGPPALQAILALQAPLPLQTTVMAQSLGYHLEQH